MSTAYEKAFTFGGAQANRPQVDPSWEMLPKPPSTQPIATEGKPRGKRKFLTVSTIQWRGEADGLSSHTRLTPARSVAFHVCFHSPRERDLPIRL